MRQRLFEELTAGEVEVDNDDDDDDDGDSTQSSPLQFSHSPIIIHGSSSEEDVQPVLELVR